ncbi:MAG: ATP-binding cassette domain-containing protein [Gammaproteobacteria bacterium]|nr:ATP-binding cassette domain-containing protein [Gammaproteobacteria bacterium]
MRDVSLAYEASIPVLRDIDLKVNEGEFVSIVGPSGCGKSTLLKLISGLVTPNQGDVRVRGTEVKGTPASIGFMFQRDALLPWASVEDNIRVGLECARVPRAEHDERIRKLLDLLGLANFGGHYPHALSGGMRQRTALGRLLAYAPEIYLMDEPFGALDALTKITMGRELLRIWSEQKRPVLFVTHDIEEAVSLSDRVVVMSGRPGTIKADHAVTLPRPRDPRKVRMQPAFHALVDEIWSDIAVE